MKPVFYYHFQNLGKLVYQLQVKNIYFIGTGNLKICFVCVYKNKWKGIVSFLFT